MKFYPYALAFGSGYVGALIPVIASGAWPDRHALIAAVAAGVLATHLLDRQSPRRTEDS